MNGCCCGMTRSSIRTYASMWNYIGWFLLGTYFVIFPFERLTYDCSCVVDDLVSQCVRKAKQCGLVMVQTPVSAFVLLQQISFDIFYLSKLDAPFSVPLSIPLTPPKADPVLQQYILSKVWRY